MNQSYQYLRDLAKIIPKKSLPIATHLLLSHGSTWESSRYQKNGEMGNCYKNAFELASQEGWDYVEGLAVSGNLFPMEHAWCLTPNGEIVDPTWENGHHYCGAVFKINFVHQIILKTQYYGIFGNLHLLGKAEGLDTPERIREFFKKAIRLPAPPVPKKTRLKI